MDRAALDTALCAAHEGDDLDALVTLYAQAADLVPEARSFYLTHAMVFALEAGDTRAGALRTALVEMGHEAPDPGAV